jgi:HEAT repeat protein
MSRQVPEARPSRRLRRPTALDALIPVGKALAWAAFAAMALAIFVALLIGALRSPEAFGFVILRLALLTIVIVVGLIVANVVQRVVDDRRERRLEAERLEIESAIKQWLRAPTALGWRPTMERYLNRLEVVELAARSFSEDEREQVCGMLGEMGAANHLERQARTARRKWRQVQALALVGWLNCLDSLELLRDALVDPDPDIGYAAAGALANQKREAAYWTLLAEIGAGRLSRSRLASILESSRYEEPIRPLLTAAYDERPELRFWVAYLLGRTRNRGALSMLISLAGDPDADVRASAAEALGDMRSREAVPILKRLLRDDQWFVRAHAAKAAGHIPDERLLEDLMPLLRDSQWWVRQDSAMALERLGRTVVPRVKDLLRDPDRFARNKAAEILGRLGVITEEAAKLAGPPAEAEPARRFLLAVAGAEAVNIIEHEALRAEPAVQAKLADVLGEAGSTGSIEVLEELRQSDQMTVRTSAEHAIERIRKVA